MLSILLMFTSLFVWAYSMPILLFLLLVGVPFVLPMILLLLGVSHVLQLIYTKPILTSPIRTYINNIDLTFWFGEIDRVPLPEKNHVIASHPHHVFCLAALLCIHFQPKSKTLIAVAPLIFHVPFMGWIAAQVGCIPSSFKSIQDALKVSSVILVPGGVPEVVSYERNELYTERYGLFKLGSPILPVVTLTKHYHVPPSPLYDLRMFIAKNYGVPIIFPWVFGWNGTWLPKRNPLKVKILEVKDRTREEYFEVIKKCIYK